MISTGHAIVITKVIMIYPIEPNKHACFYENTLSTL